MAQQFTDADGRTWEVHVDIPTAQRIRRLTEHNVLDADGKQGIISTVDDPLALAEILYAIIKPTADEQGIAAETFYAAFHGEVVTEAKAAFWEASPLFSPRPAAGSSWSCARRRSGCGGPWRTSSRAR